MDYNSFDINNINSFIEKASQVISCDQDCQKQKKSNELKQIYLDSETNLKSAPSQLKLAEKNYVTYTNGVQAYDTLQNNELEQKADLIINTFNSNFNEENKKINIAIDTYQGILLNFKNVVELYSNYKKQNIELKEELHDETSDVLTNERKTYYEDQGIENLKYYYYILLIIYIIFVLGLGISSFIYPSNFSWIKKIGIFVIFVVLPFISTWLLSIIIYLIYKIYNLLPKNVRLSE